MSDPIIFISKNRIKEGKLDEYKQFYQEVAKVFDDEKPGTVVFQAYVNEDGNEVSNVYVYLNADAMDSHMEIAAAMGKRAFELIQTVSIEIYGAPSDRARDIVKQIAGSGITISIRPQHLGGFIRLKSL